MAARLGNVVYWLGCIVAALFALAALAVVLPLFYGQALTATDAYFYLILYITGAVGSWLLGRAVRYVLAGI